MKKYAILFLFINILLLSCNENMPVIEIGPPVAPPLSQQTKKLLIEEFSGVRCVGCPAGSLELENLLNQYNDRLVVVTIHANYFATPYPENLYDFRTEEGEEILNMLGLPGSFPSAVISRKQLAGEDGLQLAARDSWAGYVAQEVDQSAKVNFNLEHNYNSADRSLMVNINGQAYEGFNEEIRLTIMITESGIVDAQLTPESSPGLDLNYVHKHVLRKTLTAFDGDVLAASIVANGEFEAQYNYTLPEEWDATSCDIIAFVHLSESSREVLQAAQVDLIE